MSDEMTDEGSSEPTLDAAFDQASEPQVEQVATEDSAPALYTVKVGGQEQQVTLEEALNGYQRQADYTAKTQELSAQREQLSSADRLWQAIESDPEYVIREMAKAYGITELQAQQQVAAAQEQRQGDDPFDFTGDGEKPEQGDPRWQQVEQFMEQAQFERAQAQIDRELSGLHTTYGVQFDDNQLLQFALEHQIADLDAAFKAFAFDRLSGVAKDRSIQQQKGSLPPVAGGHGVAAGAVTPGSGSSTPSLAEAFAAAEAAHA